MNDFALIKADFAFKLALQKEDIMKHIRHFLQEALVNHVFAYDNLLNQQPCVDKLSHIEKETLVGMQDNMIQEILMGVLKGRHL